MNEWMNEWMKVTELRSINTIFDNKMIEAWHSFLKLEVLKEEFDTSVGGNLNSPWTCQVVRVLSRKVRRCYQTIVSGENLAAFYWRNDMNT